MSQACPEPEGSQEAAEGEASHHIAAELILAYRRFNTDAPTRESMIGKTAPNGVVFTEEMYDAAEIYANDAIEVIEATGVRFGLETGVEKRIEMKRIHAESFGTPDFYLYDDKTHELFIWDYKYGYGVVEAFENWQAINYAAGLFDILGIDGTSDQFIKVRIRIAQPRAFHKDGEIREWTVTASELRGYINILSNNANKALSDKAETHSGEHCRYCSARHACSAALEAGIGLYEVTSIPLPVELSIEAIGTQLAIIKRAKKQLEYLESGFEEQVKGLIRSGKIVPGWNLEQGKGREKWAKPIEEVIALGEMFGQDLSKPPEAITPNQARKLGIDASVITAYSEVPQTGLKVVPNNANKAREVFSS